MDTTSFTDQDDAVFQEYGLSGMAGFCFHRNNLIIGKNGAGKTRFLKALEKCYKNADKNVQVITLYFPEINSKYIPCDTLEQEGEVSLYDATFTGSPLDFQDFLKLVERDGVSFLEDLFNNLNIRAKNARKQWCEGLEKLNNFLSRLLGRTLQEKKSNGQIIIEQKLGPDNKRELSLEDCFSELSPGELMLFYLSMFLFYLNNMDNGVTRVAVLMDEPELHLHPKALLDMLEAVNAFTVVSQLWIASHSLFLLPRFSFEELIYMRQGEALRLDSHTYHCIYDDLVGLDNFDMYELLCSVENWEKYQFVVENFLLPQIKDKVSDSDEQVKQLLQALRIRQKEYPLRVLDYGAGKCRIWECLKLTVPNAVELYNLLRYEAYDPYPPKERPEGVAYHTESSRMENHSYDVIILMNVLHEIEPEQWKNTFQVIYNLLKKDGVLVFVEVLSLTNGEQPYGQAGYLLLRDTQVRELFPHVHSEHLPDSGTPEKSNCWVIPYCDLKGLDNTAFFNAVCSLEQTCEGLLEEMDQMRVNMAHSSFEQVDMAKRKQTARQYAFLAQQYINAHIAKKRLEKKVPIRISFPMRMDDDTSHKLDFPGLSQK